MFGGWFEVGIGIFWGIWNFGLVFKKLKRGVIRIVCKFKVVVVYGERRNGEKGVRVWLKIIRI